MQSLVTYSNYAHEDVYLLFNKEASKKTGQL